MKTRPEQPSRRLTRKAIELWSTGDEEKDLHNRRAWLKAIEYLGDKWLLAKPISRIKGA